MLKGVDVSGYQSADFDFSPYDFGIVKVSEGLNTQNRNYPAQAQKCVSQGRLLGLYHYAHPETNTAAAEVKDFLGRCKQYIGKAILCLDWEGDAVGQPVSWALDWCNRVQQETGVRPFFYSYSSYLRVTDCSSIAKKFPLWLAQYTSGTPSWGNDWKKWTIWQYTSDPVDTNYFDGTKQDWQAWCGNVQAGWIDTINKSLTSDQQENNAQLVMEFFRSKGWTLESICGLLGNMQTESTINPGVWQNLTAWGNPTGKGFGLVQWTPYTRITDWMTAHGYKINDGPGQLNKIMEELEHPEIERVWLPTSTYNISFQEFTQSNQTPDWLARAWLYDYGRGSYGTADLRAKRAMAWWSFLQGAPIFEPRTTPDGIKGNPMWYKDNPFYQAGYGLPNCTCYCWGRWWEITGTRPLLPLGNAGNWFDSANQMGLPTGQTPQLGAVVVTRYGSNGHVSIVEQINDDGSILVSNSGWPSTFFWMETLYPPNYIARWMPAGAKVQGFIYLPTQPTPPDPVIPPDYFPVAEDSRWIYYNKLF